jgi:hypothetical protein
VYGTRGRERPPERLGKRGSRVLVRKVLRAPKQPQQKAWHQVITRKVIEKASSLVVVVNGMIGVINGAYRSMSVRDLAD